MEASGIHIKHATIKHAQTIGVIERSHQNLKELLKIRDDRSLHRWVRYVNLAFLVHKSNHHQSITYSCSESFLVEIHFNALPLKFTNPTPANGAKTDIKTLINQINEKKTSTAATIFEAFHKYKRYYDRKAQAELLKASNFTIQFNPGYTTPLDETKFQIFHWISPYEITEVL